MIRSAILLFVVGLFATSLSAQIARSWLGITVDTNGGLRPVYGVPASTTLGDIAVGGVISAGCGSSMCLAVTADGLWSSVTRNGTESVSMIPAPTGPALFAFSNADAYVFFQNPQALYRCYLTKDGEIQLDPVAFSADGEILSMRISGDGFDYAARRDGDVWMEHYSPVTTSVVSVVTATPWSGAVHLFEDGALLADDVGVRLIRSNGMEFRYSIAGVAGFAPMSPGYVRVTATEGTWAIRTDAGQEQAFLLPGVSAAAPIAIKPIRRPPAKKPCCGELQ